MPTPVLAATQMDAHNLPPATTSRKRKRQSKTNIDDLHNLQDKLKGELFCYREVEPNDFGLTTEEVSRKWSVLVGFAEGHSQWLPALCYAPHVVSWTDRFCGVTIRNWTSGCPCQRQCSTWLLKRNRGRGAAIWRRLATWRKRKPYLPVVTGEVRAGLCGVEWCCVCVAAVMMMMMEVLAAAGRGGARTRPLLLARGRRQQQSSDTREKAWNWREKKFQRQDSNHMGSSAGKILKYIHSSIACAVHRNWDFF